MFIYTAPLAPHGEFQMKYFEWRNRENFVNVTTWHGSLWFLFSTMFYWLRLCEMNLIELCCMINLALLSYCPFTMAATLYSGIESLY